MMLLHAFFLFTFLFHAQCHSFCDNCKSSPATYLVYCALPHIPLAGYRWNSKGDGATIENFKLNVLICFKSPISTNPLSWAQAPDALSFIMLQNSIDLPSQKTKVKSNHGPNFRSPTQLLGLIERVGSFTKGTCCLHLQASCYCRESSSRLEVLFGLPPISLVDMLEVTSEGFGI
jgi:hypothetical protein